MNNDLIRREALKKHKVYSEERHEYIVPVYDIDNAPTVEENWKFYYEHGYAQAKKEFERPQGEWKDYSDDGFVECPFCHKATTCEDNIDELHFCWNCGAKMINASEVRK